MTGFPFGAAWSWAAVSTLFTLVSGCALPSANIGRPVPPGRGAVTVSMGQAIGASEFNGYVEPDEDGPPSRESSTFPQGLGVPASGTVGLRMGLVPRVDLGGELSPSLLGVNTRVGLSGTAQTPRFVWTLDGRLGLWEGETTNPLIPPYDVTSRLFAYAPFSATGAYLVGGGIAWGYFGHIAVRDSSGFAPSVEHVYARELRVHGLIGLSGTIGDNPSEVCAYLDPYVVLHRQDDAPFGYEHYGAVVLSLTATLTKRD